MERSKEAQRLLDDVGSVSRQVTDLLAYVGRLERALRSAVYFAEHERLPPGVYPTLNEHGQEMSDKERLLWLLDVRR